MDKERQFEDYISYKNVSLKMAKIPGLEKVFTRIADYYDALASGMSEEEAREYIKKVDK